MQVKYVDFLLTFKCNSQCSHCAYKAGPERDGYIKFEIASQYLKELTEIGPLQSLYIHGGEPFLYFDILERIIKKAKELKVPQRGVITNGYWGKNEDHAMILIKKLYLAGLTHITFSVDGFHQEFIPIEHALTAITTTANLSFEKISIDSYFLGEFDSDNNYNNLTLKVLEKINRIGEFQFNRYNVHFEGRGTDLADFIERKVDLPSSKCPIPFWIGGDFKNPETIEIDWEGNVTLCPGLCIGNTRINSLKTIIQEYNVLNHPILLKLWEKGPKELLTLAEEKGFQQSQQYINECHLCYEIRKFLQPYFPQYLAPKECY